MDFESQYVVLLVKGSAWTGEPSPRLKALQTEHLAHLDAQRQAGRMTHSGPVEDHVGGAHRGICIYDIDVVGGPDELRTIVEGDPMIQAEHLAAVYLTWFTPVGTMGA